MDVLLEPRTYHRVRFVNEIVFFFVPSHLISYFTDMTLTGTDSMTDERLCLVRHDVAVTTPTDASFLGHPLSASCSMFWTPRVGVFFYLPGNNRVCCCFLALPIAVFLLASSGVISGSTMSSYLSRMIISAGK